MNANKSLRFIKRVTEKVWDESKHPRRRGKFAPKWTAPDMVGYLNQGVSDTQRQQSLDPMMAQAARHRTLLPGERKKAFRDQIHIGYVTRDARGRTFTAQHLNGALVGRNFGSQQTAETALREYDHAWRQRGHRRGKL